MPIYEYKCKECKKEFEVIKSITECSLEKCPICKQLTQRHISSTSFLLRGGGWEKDGYNK